VLFFAEKERHPGMRIVEPLLQEVPLECKPYSFRMNEELFKRLACIFYGKA
jgi:hypothetical protein